MANDIETEDRRKFLISCGKFAAITPPAMTLLLSTSLTSTAIARSGGQYGSDSRPGRSFFDNDPDRPGKPDKISDKQNSREAQSSQRDDNHASLGSGGGGGGGGDSGANATKGGGSGGSRGGGSGATSRFGGGEDDKWRKGDRP